MKEIDGKMEKKMKRMKRTKEQQHEFNFPFQVGTNGDDAFKADNFEHEVEEMDIIIVASDGIFDNMYDADLVDCVKSNNAEDFTQDSQGTADCIAAKSYELGKKNYYISPFAKGAHMANKDYGMHGKEDDISVVVAQIHSRTGKFAENQGQELQSNGSGSVTASLIENEDL
jgi:protein phosphatase PTC7